MVKEYERAVIFRLGRIKEAPKAQVIYSRKGAILLLEAGVTRKPYMFVPSI